MTSNITHNICRITTVLGVALIASACTQPQALPADNATAQSPAAAQTPTANPTQGTSPLTGTRWQLIKLHSADDAQGTTRIPDPSRFTMSFGNDGRAALRLDCNQGNAGWKSDKASAASGTLVLDPIISTLAACVEGGGLDARVVMQLRNVRSFLIKDGHLHLSLFADAGVMEWEPMR
jgi:hypothetical protein